ncbi:MAG: hypothetical protein NkDv07_0889 [Candidatus Improbicoccus devescovinae]|nr:MAG: hypothetical protein NkDv07_0889 [Candidatus Improbicoccus devescovinae]
MHQKNIVVKSEQKKNKIYIKFIFMFIVLCVITLASIFYLNFSGSVQFILGIKNNISSFFGSRNFPVDIPGQFIEPDNFCEINRKVLCLSNSCFSVFNSKGNQIYSDNHDLSVPRMKVANNRVLLYDLGGHNFRLEYLNKRIFCGDLKNKITDASISCKGDYGFIADSLEYLAEMFIFNAKNSLKYRYCFANCYPTCMALNDDGKQAAIAGIYTENGKPTSSIKIFELNKEIPKFNIKIEDNMFFNIEFFSNSNSVVAIGDRSLVFVNNNDGSFKEIKYDDQKLCSKFINKNDGVAITLSPNCDDYNQIIKIFNKKGNLISNIESKSKINSVSYKNGMVSAVSENFCTIYDAYGLIYCRIKNPVCTKKIELISNSCAYILGTGVFDILYLN